MEIKQVSSPNYTPGRPGWDGLYIIVLHTMEGYLNGADAWFNNPASQVSTHYGVGFNGEIHQYVNEDDIAWANGQDYANRNGISIEFEDQQNPYDATRTDALYETGAQLIADICKRRNIACNTSGIKRHNEFVDKVCPGALDVNRLINRANEILNVNQPEMIDGVTIQEYRQACITKDGVIKGLQAQLESSNKTIDDQKIEIYNLGQQVSDLQKQVDNLKNIVVPKKSKQSFITTIFNFLFSLNGKSKTNDTSSPTVPTSSMD